MNECLCRLGVCARKNGIEQGQICRDGLPIPSVNSFAMQDIVSANVVELTIDETGKLWLNVDGKCGFRIGEVTSFVVEAPGIAKCKLSYPVDNYFIDDKRVPVERRQPEVDLHYAGSDRRMGTRRK